MDVHTALIPKTVSRAFEDRLRYLDMKGNPHRFVRMTFLKALIVGMALGALSFVYFDFSSLHGVAGLVVGFIGMLGLTFLQLDLAADSKGKWVESVLPDALQLISSNIRSGLTTERALLVSARPEFGPLEKELKRASTRVLSGSTVEEALLDIPKRIKSSVVERTVWLISKGVRAGGEMADLLAQLSNNLREQLTLQAEARASVSIYVMLIFFSAAIGGPALYAVSSFIVEVMAAQSSTAPAVDPSQLAAAGSRAQGLSGFLGGKTNIIDPDFVVFFTMVMLLVGGFFASLILGAIATGKEKNGFKYLPFVLGLSFLVFFAIRYVLVGAFGSLLLR
ncbi:MAG: type II secretion system F family protein [Candidatus Diapherotrites archaeon]|nr:type II secretion system F family protein [Candidatus Diapherotrites archaeon]